MSVSNDFAHPSSSVPVGSRTSQTSSVNNMPFVARYPSSEGASSVSGSDAESLKVLDLKSETVRAAVAEAVTAEAVYEKYGYDYK